MLKYLIVLSFLLNRTYGEVIGTFVVPHGGLALDPTHSRLNASAMELAKEIHQALIQISKEVDQLKPDIVFLSTPHGLADMDRFLFYLNKQAKGIAFAEDCMNITECGYHLNLTIAVSESLVIMEHLKHAHKVSGISAFGPPGEDPQMGPLPLAWGEIIPLYFMRRLESTKFIIFSHPSRRYNHSQEMIPEMLHLGRSLYLRLHQLKEKVAVIISADLAHTHSKDGPYGFSPAAQPFDDAVGMWLKTLDPTQLLETAGNLVSEALSCGFPGMVMLHAMLSEAGLKQWTTNLLVNGHPTYYGMAVGSMLVKEFSYGNEVVTPVGDVRVVLPNRL